MRNAHALAAGCVATLVSALALTACGGAEARLGGHMERGQEYFAEENYEKARVEFRNALQIAPEDAQARYMTAVVAEKLGNIADAARLYQSTLEADAGHLKARAALGRVYVFAGMPDKAKEIIESGLASHPEDPDLLTVRGALRMQLKDPAGALADAEQAVKLAPSNENAAALLASMYRQNGQVERAIGLLKETIERVPSSVELRPVLASLYTAMGERELADEQLRKIIELRPKELRYRQLLAQSYVVAKELDKADEAMRDTIAALPESTDAKLAYVEFIAAQRSMDRAMESLRAFIAKEPDNYELQFGLGSLQMRARRTEDALATYRRILEADKDGVQGLAARNRIAAIHVGARRYDEASKLVAEVLKENPQDNDALILRANMAMERGDPAAAITDLRSVLRDQPQAIGILRALARAHLANSEPTLAEESLRNALEVAPTDVALRVELGQLLTQTGRVEQAVPILEEAVNRAPDNAGAREAMIRALIGTNELDAARRAAEDLKLVAPSSASGSFLAGMVAQNQGRLDDAQREFEKALKLQPQAMDALTALTRLDMQRGRGAAAISRIQAAIDGGVKNPITRNMLAEVYLAQKEPGKALPLLAEALKESPKWWVLHRNFASAKLLAGDQAGAIAAYEAGIRATNHQPALVADLASIYERLNRIDDAIAQYEELHRRNPRLDLAANNLAMLLVTYKQDPASLDRARDLSAPFATSEVAAYLDTHGWVRFKRGEIHQALPVLERAAAESPDSKVVLFHLGMAQSEAGERDKAIATLEKALAGDGKFAGNDEARLTLARLKGGEAG